MKTIVGLYMQKEEATKAVGVLENAGFSPASMRVLRSAGAIWQHLGCTPGRVLVTDFAIGAVLGIALYSLMGVIVAVGEEALGFERATAMGALSIFALAGVFVGGMLGFFFGLGNLEQESRLYLAGISRGGVLLVVRTADEHAGRALDVLNKTEAQGVKICWRTSDHPASHGLPPSKDRLSQWARWGARGLGLALIVLVLLFFIGEGLLGADMPDLLAMSLAEDFLFVALLMMLAGVVVAWRWEAIGGMLIVGSVLLFEGINALGSGYWQFGLFDTLFLLVGLLFLLDWWHTAGGTGHPPTATSA